MAVMGDLLDALPIAATAFAIPQFLPVGCGNSDMACELLVRLIMAR